MITDERLKEMQERFHKAGGDLVEAKMADRELLEKGKRIGTGYVLRLEISPLEALVSSGVAKSMEEAGEFLTILLTGLSYAVHKGELNQEDVANTALKTGFYIGLLAGRPNASAN